MAYRFDIGQPVQAQVHRVAREQIDKALKEIADEQLDRHEAVHQVRKRCKKLRGLLRLVRGSLSDPDAYSFENGYFRDAARSLSALRDAEALIEAYDKLLNGCDAGTDVRRLSCIRDGLVSHKQRISRETQDLAEALSTFAGKMEESRSRIDIWRLDTDGYEAVAYGLKKTYGRGRRAMEQAYDEPCCETFHEWRKRVKYHWYHCRLLRNVWRPVLKARVDELDRLATLLGDYHDLDVLRSQVERMAGQTDPQARDRLGAIMDERQQQLRNEAHPLGAKLFAEKSKHLCRRVECFWNA